MTIERSSDVTVAERSGSSRDVRRMWIGRKGSMAESHCSISPRASGEGIRMRPCTGALLCFGGYAYTKGPVWGSVGADDVALCGFERRLLDEKGRLELRDSAGTRNAQTEWAVAGPRLDGRKACVRALRKHVCAVLIERFAAWTVRGNACRCIRRVSCDFFHP